MIYPFLVRRAVFIWEVSFPLLFPSSTAFLFIYLFIYSFIIIHLLFFLYYVVVQWYKVLLNLT